MRAELVDHMGNDDSVVNAARVSFDKLAEHFSEEENASLLRFLARGCSTKDWRSMLSMMARSDCEIEVEELVQHIRKIPKHWVPFAHTAITLRMGAPVPIRVQAFKHKQGLVESEESRRYISSRPEVYVPDYFRSAAKDKKQGSGAKHYRSDYWSARYSEATSKCIRTYMAMIEDGICPEQARFVLPQGVMVNWIWTGNLYAFANFYNARTDSHAQREIQDLAHAVGDIIAPLYPVAWSALTA